MAATQPQSQQLACLEGQKLLVQCRASHAWAKQPCLLGIDEAGRGPVLGPMVYAAAYAPLASDLKSKDFNDSKQLTEAKRDTLFASISSDTDIGYVANILSAQMISSSMLSRHKTSLNRIAEESTFRIIQTALDAGVNIKEVFVDTVGDAERYERTLSNRFPALKFKVCPKADALFPIVSAASIVAKVIRDRSLLACQKALGLTGEMGSGYPGDATTAAWLKASLHPVLGFPKIVRFSWETCTRLMADPSAGCVGISFEADLEEPDPQQQKLCFGPATGAGNGSAAAPGAGGSNRVLPETSGMGRHVYFKARRLQAVAEAF